MLQKVNALVDMWTNRQFNLLLRG